MGYIFLPEQANLKEELTEFLSDLKEERNQITVSCFLTFMEERDFTV
jgi:hypothetical protein